MKKLISAILVFLMMSQLAVTCLAAEKPYTISDAHYVLNEDWVATGVHNGPDAPSGWDAHTMAGKIKTGWGTFYMEDTNKYLGIDMSRKFEKVSGKQDLTLSFRFSFETFMNNVRFQLKNGDSVVYSVETRHGGVYLVANNAEYALAEAVEPNVNYGVKVVLNQVTNRITAFFNAEIPVRDLAISGDTSVDNMYIDTGIEDTGKILIPHLRLHYNYYVNETFITNYDRKIPKDWNIDGTASLETVEAERDGYYMYLDSGKAEKSYIGNSDVMTYSFRTIQSAKSDGFSANLGGSSIISTSGGAFCYSDKNGTKIPFYANYMQNLWYYFKIYVYYDRGVYDIRLNGRTVAEDLPILGTNNGIISFSCDNGVKTGIDDIEIYPRIYEPEDYVEAPNVVASGDYYIGMQSCSLWQNGKQFGWDCIAAFPDRKPYMGYYDEPKSEVADWEIKWMSEHGINFQTYCWFRPGGGDGTPIKNPPYADALNDGYMDAKYSNNLKYMIMFENANSGFSGEQDFRENLVPYWIEYYFKDSRYMTINNKPVLSFFSYQRLIDVFGTRAKVKENMDWLREECKKIGFDGAIIWVASQAMSGTQLEECGIDAYYAYNWGSQGGNPDIQKNGMIQRRNNGMDMISTLAQGWNSEAWDGNKGSYLSIEEFTDLAKWVKNEFIPSCDDGFAKNVVMLDNWNEFGEGHFMNPSELAGFGYLDVIRDVFVTNSAHTDVKPTEHQKSRINMQYPQDRNIVVTAKGADPSKYPTEVAMEWNFDNDLDGWSILTCIKSLTWENGVIHGVSNGSDPIIQSPDNLNLNLTDVTHVKIRMKHATNDTYTQLMFKTNAEPSYIEPARAYTFAKEKDQEYHDYWIETADREAWKGTLKQLRFDPFDSPGEFWVDSITLYKKSHKPTDKLALDGSDEDIVPVMKNDTLYVPFRQTFELLGANIDWYDAENKAVAAISGNLIEIYPDKKVFGKNLKEESLTNEPYIEDGTLYINAELIRKALDVAVSADMEKNVVTIVTKNLEWSFEKAGLDGWSLSDNLSCPIVTGEYLRVKNKGGEASMYSPATIELPGASIKNFKIKLKNETSAKYAKIQYMTERMTKFDDAHSQIFEIKANDTDFTEYTVPVSIEDKITQLRIVLTNSEGNTEIAYIRAEI